MKASSYVRWATVVASLLIRSSVFALPLESTSSIESFVRGTYAPQVQSQMGAFQYPAQSMLIAGRAGAEKRYYGGNDAAGVAQAILKDLQVITRDPMEFLSAMEFTIIGLCYRVTILPPSIRIGPYYAYYWPTQVNEMADTRQSEYIPEAVFDMFDGTIGLEDMLYPHVQGDTSFFSQLGVDAPHAVARAGKVAARNGDIAVPEKADVIDLVEDLPKNFRWHAGSDGATNLKEWRYLPHILQILYAQGGGFGLLDHKRQFSTIPLIFSEMPMINDITRVAEWSNLLFPTVMGAPEIAGGAGGVINSQFGLKANPGRCIGHDIWLGNTPGMSFFPVVSAVNQGLPYRVPTTNRDLCTQNIGADYPVTTSANVPVSRMPHMSYIRSLNLLGHESLSMLTGGIRGGYFDLKKYRSLWGRADKIQFRDSNKDGNARFLMDNADNKLWRSLMNDKTSWVGDISDSPESFRSSKYRGNLDPDDAGRAVSYDWTGFRFCQSRMRPLVLFGFTDDRKNPQIKGSEVWPGGGGGSL